MALVLVSQACLFLVSFIAALAAGFVVGTVICCFIPFCSLLFGKDNDDV